MKKTLYYFAAIILITIIYVGYATIFNTKKEIESAKIDYIVNANKLMQEFEQNENIASNKYVNKIIEVKGCIGEIIETADKKTALILKEKDDIFGINCMLDDKNSAINKYIVGDSVSIKGVVQGYLSDVILTNCFITK